MESSQRRLRVLTSHLACPSAQLTAGTTSPLALTSPYTFDNGVLSVAERQQYERDGFVVRRGILDADSIATFRDRFRQLCSNQVSSPGVTFMRDVAIAKSEFVPGEQAVTKIQDFQNDEVLFRFCNHPNVVAVVKAFTGEDVMAMHTMLINKPPDPGSESSRHPLHQDLYYFPFRPAERIVCAWTALEYVHRRNGCLVVIPGTHRIPLLPHAYPKWKGGVNKLYHGIPEELVEKHRDGLVYLEMQPGDTVFFHPLLIHGSGRNRTDGFRKAISCHYASSHCCYIDVSNGSQSKIAEEIGTVARSIMKKRGMPMSVDLEFSYEDLWRLRARLVAGSEGSLS